MRSRMSIYFSNVRLHFSWKYLLGRYLNCYIDILHEEKSFKLDNKKLPLHFYKKCGGSFNLVVMKYTFIYRSVKPSLLIDLEESPEPLISHNP